MAIRRIYRRRERKAALDDRHIINALIQKITYKNGRRKISKDIRRREHGERRVYPFYKDRWQLQQHRVHEGSVRSDILRNQVDIQQLY